MTRAVRSLMISVLLCGSARAGSPAERQSRTHAVLAPITLTNNRTVGYFPLDAETVERAPSVLALNITRVHNPGDTPIQVLVYLSCRPQTGRSELKKILIGNAGFYPPDHAAGVVLRASTAFRELKTARVRPSDVRLLLEMRRIDEAKPWTPVEVTVAPPEWRDQASPP